MRTRTLLLAVLAAALALPAAIGAANSIPGSGYPWQEPGCAPVANTYAQPPASIPIAPTVVVPAQAGSDYAWVQPDCAPVTWSPAQPAAWIPPG
jgi:hypothetical protein